MNRETKYFDALVRLFDLYLAATQLKEACETLDRLVDIDPYDYRNQERIGKLEGKVDPGIPAERAFASGQGRDGLDSHRWLSQAPVRRRSRPPDPLPKKRALQQALEDLVVQVEIFLQYSLQTKAVERLERIAELFPGEEDKNERLRALYERANWWPKGAPRKAAPAAPSSPRLRRLRLLHSPPWPRQYPRRRIATSRRLPKSTG